VLLLVGVEGMRYEEAANVLGVPVGTVRSRVSRGRDTLRRFMGMNPERLAANEARQERLPKQNKQNLSRRARRAAA